MPATLRLTIGGILILWKVLCHSRPVASYRVPCPRRPHSSFFLRLATSKHQVGDEHEKNDVEPAHDEFDAADAFEPHDHLCPDFKPDNRCRQA